MSTQPDKAMAYTGSYRVISGQFWELRTKRGGVYLASNIEPFNLDPRTMTALAALDTDIGMKRGVLHPQTFPIYDDTDDPPTPIVSDELCFLERLKPDLE